MPEVMELSFSHRRAASKADFFAMRSLTRVWPTACKACTGPARAIASPTVRAPLPGTLAAWLLMVAIRAAALLSTADEDPENELTAESSALRPLPTAFRTLVIAGTSLSTGVPRPTRTGSEITPTAKVARENAVLNFILTVGVVWLLVVGGQKRVTLQVVGRLLKEWLKM